MGKRQWTEDGRVLATNPGDGEQPIVYWWDGMTADDARGMVKVVYDRAYAVGAQDGIDASAEASAVTGHHLGTVRKALRLRDEAVAEVKQLRAALGEYWWVAKGEDPCTVCGRTDHHHCPTKGHRPTDNARLAEIERLQQTLIDDQRESAAKDAVHREALTEAGRRGMNEEHKRVLEALTRETEAADAPPGMRQILARVMGWV